MPIIRGKKPTKIYIGIHPIKVKLNTLIVIGSMGAGAVKFTIYASLSALRFKRVVAKNWANMFKPLILYFIKP